LRAGRGARPTGAEDIAIVGFDGTEESAYSRPSLTTIAPDKAAIAEQAVKLLHRRVNSDGSFPPEDIQTPSRYASGEHHRLAW